MNQGVDAGKTTLLKMLTGQLPLAGGWREEGETTVVGHFKQQPPPVPEHLRIVDYIRRVSYSASLETFRCLESQVISHHMEILPAFLEGSRIHC